MQTTPTAHNKHYIDTKRAKLGHIVRRASRLREGRSRRATRPRRVRADEFRDRRGALLRGSGRLACSTAPCGRCAMRRRRRTRRADRGSRLLRTAARVPKADRSRAFDGIVALGVVIRGETPHFEYVAGECARGIMDVQLATAMPIGFGVLTTEDVEQARPAGGRDGGDKGYAAGHGGRFASVRNYRNRLVASEACLELA